MKENKSPGVDGVSPKKCVRHVFNMPLHEGIVPL